MGFGDDFFGAKPAEWYNTQISHYLIKYGILKEEREAKNSGKNSKEDTSHEVYVEIMDALNGLLKDIKKYNYELSIKNKILILSDEKLMEACDKFGINYRYLKKGRMAA